jgi:solute carrier family 6 amino acid/orphan transporter-like 15/16/17/18/20
MTGSRPNVYFLFCWKYLSPMAMIIMLFMNLYGNIETGMSYEIWNRELAKTEKKPWPSHVLTIGFIIAFISVAPIPIMALFK